ncbi:DegV family protein [Clostridium bowmanii]|uniref:DegV family protein n=1 Tax=Clostridium bowmanii TaxID=132925 RepID=UPI001C0CEA31|nr:DegV family protein [Clostridium bowmanii]MBU3188219.1 DegV family protein [Clostridium bowmanii]MCA1072605.1 DegV family protein [Clostridium bowmanii]
MKPLIVTDSDCDLSAKYIKQNNISTIPFYFNLKGIDYEDNLTKSIGYKEFFDELSKGEMPTTSQITPYKFEEYFRKYISEGYSIIYIAFSSGLSETYNNAVRARETIIEENSSADITVIDSRRATAGQGLLVYYACEMLAQGKSKENIINWIEDNKLKVNLWFTVDSLEHLKRGGRISATSATVGTLLEIKPILDFDNTGKLVTVKKVRGRKKSIRVLLEEFKDKVINPEEQTIFINHGDCLEDAEHLKSLVMSQVKVKNVIINYVGPIIGTHTGKGILCIAFIGKVREA